jgi:hypothetical protein
MYVISLAQGRQTKAYPGRVGPVIDSSITYVKINKGAK